VPEPGAGFTVDPLGEGLRAGFPEGFTVLFAPAAILPALLSKPLLVELPAELPVVVPFVVDPVVVPLGEGPPTELVLPVEPVPVCAIANVLMSVSAAASPIVLSFMVLFLCPCERKNGGAPICSGIDINWV
jgi:hypothetical protein